MIIDWPWNGEELAFAHLPNEVVYACECENRTAYFDVAGICILVSGKCDVYRRTPYQLFVWRPNAEDAEWWQDIFRHGVENRLRGESDFAQPRYIDPSNQVAEWEKVEWPIPREWVAHLPPPLVPRTSDPQFYGVFVLCDDECHQRKLLERFAGNKFKCRAWNL